LRRMACSRIDTHNASEHSPSDLEVPSANGAITKMAPQRTLSRSDISRTTLNRPLSAAGRQKFLTTGD